MAKWNKSKVLPENINIGNEFAPKDNLTVEELNAIVNNSFYGVDFVEGFTETPDVSDANNVGTPQVSLIPYTKDGKTLYKFKFSNLKGQQGVQGVQGQTGQTGATGERGEAGLSALVYDGAIEELFEPYYGDYFNAIPERFDREVIKDELSLFLWTMFGGNPRKTFIVIGRYTGNTSNESLVFKIEQVMETTGAIGDNVELRYYNNYIQWKPTQSTTWNNLIAVSDLTDLSNYATKDEIPKHTISLIPVGDEITSNVDLNSLNYIKVGLYYCSQNKTAQSLSNCPTDEAFMMQVYNPLDTSTGNETTSKWVYRLRKIITLNGKEYTQLVFSGETIGSFTYNAWVKTTQDSELANYVKTSGTQTIGGLKTFSYDVSVGSSLKLLSSSNGGIEIGRTDGTSSTPYIDFHTDGATTDYNVRLIASGGTAGTTGDGTLNISAGAVTLNGSKLIAQNKFSMRHSSTVGKFYYNTGDGEKEVQLNLYPVGSIYLTVSTSPLGSSPASWIGGKWERLPEGYALWTASSDAGNTISAGLPNITGSFAGVPVGSNFSGSQSGAFASSSSSGSSNTWGSSNAGRATINFNANDGASVKGIYGASSTVQPPAYKVYAWRRTE